MNSFLKFTVGNALRGYKSVEISFDDTLIEYKILRNELIHVDKSQISRVQLDKTWLETLDALKIFDWQPFYGENSSNGVHWSLIFKRNGQIYRGNGFDAFPDGWEMLLDLLDALIPDINFVDGNRIDQIELILSRKTDFDIDFSEKLTLNRAQQALTIEKSDSTHVYRLSTDSTNDFLDFCQRFFDETDINPVDDAKNLLFGSISRHDGSSITFKTEFSEDFMPGIVDFAEKMHSFATDLTAKLFSPEKMRRIDPEKIILCKVQFKNNYKSYTYRAEDETLSVGDLVDVPVGRNNDVTQAKIVDIGYFDAQDAPFSLEKIKFIIGKHVSQAWEDI